MSKSDVKVLYREVQRPDLDGLHMFLAPGARWLILIAITAAVIIFSKIGRAEEGGDPGVIVVCVGVIFFAGFDLAQTFHRWCRASMTTEVTAEGIRIELSPYASMFVPLGEVRCCSAIRTPMFNVLHDNFSGLGHGSLDMLNGRSQSFAVRGQWAVKLYLTGKRNPRVIIGTQDPDALLAAIQQAVDASPAVSATEATA